MEREFQSLSSLLEQIKAGIKYSLPESYWVVCEILDFNENRSGHCYLDLVEKEEKSDALKARIKGMIWANRYRMLKPYFETSTGSTLKSGIKLLCRVIAEFHPVYGISLQIVDLDPSYTLGDLTRKKQEVIRRLREEGIFEMNRELDFPLVPQRIAIISSDTAAGYGDFIESLHKNTHGFHYDTELFPALMQGNEAPASMIAALEKVAEREDEFDCLVLIRGGGARADLECFNDYNLNANLVQFPLPVITGIGHERDESVSDLIASRALKTPTAVAEFLVDALLSFFFRLNGLHDRLRSSVSHQVQKEELKLSGIHSSLKYSSMTQIQLAEKELTNLPHRIQYSSQMLLEQAATRLRELPLRLERSSLNLLDASNKQLAALGKRRELNDPANILKKGFSITLSGGHIVKGVKDLKEGDPLETRLGSGSIESTVKKIIDHE